MTYSGVNLKSLGFIVYDVKGVLDMPSRKGETIYDWGDEVSALVDADDIYFNSRKIEVSVFFDARLGLDFRSSLNTLKSNETTETLSTQYGDYLCKLSNIDVIKDYRLSGKTLKLTFIETNPVLEGDLPNKIGNHNISIDGYNFFEFGLLIKSVNGFNVPQLKSSKKTSFKNNYISIYRELPELNIDVCGVYISNIEMSEKLNKLNNLLSKEGFRHFIYNGYGYQCFCTNGYSVKVKKNIVNITIKLKVMSYYNIDEIVQKVIDQITVVASPQSDLTQTDSSKPDFIKGKDSFQASDSLKLNGNDDSYFAKESEMEGIRGLDLENQLETGTDF